MWRCSRDLNIDDVLRDPIIGAQMKADHVTAPQFEALLRSVAARLSADDKPPRPLRKPARMPALHCSP